jgi:hypothetical protein
MKKIGMGLVGPGFVAEQHIDAVRRLGDVDVVATTVRFRLSTRIVCSPQGRDWRAQRISERGHPEGETRGSVVGVTAHTL